MHDGANETMTVTFYAISLLLRTPMCGAAMKW
jgi:hypothetical protein